MKFDFLSDAEIKRIILEARFVSEKEIYSSTYYRKGKTRNIIFKGNFENKKAILKMWKDPREVYEPLNLKEFLKNNKSEILTAPKLYNYKMYDDHSGWLIEEYIDTSKHIFEGMPKVENREEFFKVFIEYKKIWPKNPELKIFKDKTVGDWALRNISKWKKLAKEKSWLKQESYDLCEKAIDVLKKDGNGYKFIWTHGHFKPKEIFKVNPPTSCGTSADKYYLTDFAHCCWQPEFAEGPFIVWSIIQDARKIINYDLALKESLDWKNIFVKNELTDKKGFDLGMLGRSVGTILADIGGSDIPLEEKEKLLEIWTKILKYYLDSLK
ncbi:MAG: hypothetical protein WC663_04270 [Patescibacteria group bacterium]|jgi:hypothetical protein